MPLFITVLECVPPQASRLGQDHPVERRSFLQLALRKVQQEGPQRLLCMCLRMCLRMVFAHAFGVNKGSAPASSVRDLLKVSFRDPNRRLVCDRTNQEVQRSDSVFPRSSTARSIDPPGLPAANHLRGQGRPMQGKQSDNT